MIDPPIPPPPPPPHRLECVKKFGLGKISSNILFYFFHNPSCTLTSPHFLVFELKNAIYGIFG